MHLKFRLYELASKRNIILGRVNTDLTECDCHTSSRSKQEHYR